MGDPAAAEGVAPDGVAPDGCGSDAQQVLLAAASAAGAASTPPPPGRMCFPVVLSPCNHTSSGPGHRGLPRGAVSALAPAGHWAHRSAELAGASRALGGPQEQAAGLARRKPGGSNWGRTGWSMCDAPPLVAPLCSQNFHGAVSLRSQLRSSASHEHTSTCLHHSTPPPLQFHPAPAHTFAFFLYFAAQLAPRRRPLGGVPPLARCKLARCTTSRAHLPQHGCHGWPGAMRTGAAGCGSSRR